MMILGCGLFISAFTFLTEHLCSLVEHKLLQDSVNNFDCNFHNILRST